MEAGDIISFLSSEFKYLKEIIVGGFTNKEIDITKEKSFLQIHKYSKLKFKEGFRVVFHNNY